jgi:hypothetical protein
MTITKIFDTFMLHIISLYKRCNWKVNDVEDQFMMLTKESKEQSDVTTSEVLVSY